MIAYAITSKVDIDSKLSKANYILFRDKNSDSYLDRAKIFIKNSKSYSFDKILLHQDYNLAYELKADGVHFTSKQLFDIPKAKELNLFVIVSTHNYKEITLAIENGADMVTFSPIFYTPNKGEPKGIEELKRVINRFNIPIIALGGIVRDSHIQMIRDSGAVGFASIRYF